MVNQNIFSVKSCCSIFLALHNNLKYSFARYFRKKAQFEDNPEILWFSIAANDIAIVFSKPAIHLNNVVFPPFSPYRKPSLLQDED
jgi:hypothetical protein